MQAMQATGAMVGRDGERAVVARFVAALAGGPAALTIEGAAGIGKTALFRHAVGIATSAGIRVLRAAPGEPEARLTFSGLTDLLATVESRHIEMLPEPQRQAIGAATLREPAGAEPPDERAIGTGLAALLNALAREAPLLVAVDDAQWLDAPTASALAFALRRASGPVGVLAARRVPSSQPEIAAALSGVVWNDRVTLGGLSLGATFVMVRERLGIALPRVRLGRLWEASQGNPLLALELARAAEQHDDDVLAGHLPLSERLDALLGARLAALVPAAAEACLAVASSARPTIGLLRGLGLAEGLAAAESAGVLAVEPARVRFAHPLLASAALSRASGPQRRAMHAALAGVVEGAEERARHLALADPAPSAESAGALEQAATAAARRGAITAAIELARLAVERTPSEDRDALWRRRVTLATSLFAAGESEAARDTLAQRDGECPPGRLRAEAELLMVEVAFVSTTGEEARLCADAALAHAGPDPVLRARALLSLDVVDQERGRDYAGAAQRALEGVEHPDPLVLAWVRMAGLYARQAAGDPIELGEIDAVVAHEREGRVWRSTDNASANRPVLLRWLDRPDAALEALDELERRAEEEGNEGGMPYLLGHRASCLLALSRFREAADTAARHLAHAEATHQAGQACQGQYLLASAATYRGDFAAARAHLQEAFGSVAEQDDPWVLERGSGLLGVIELAHGHVAAAREHLDRWHASAQRLSGAAPAVTRCYVDYTEALLACGDRPSASALADDLVRSAARARRGAPLAAGHHCRALVAVHDGELRDALTELDVVLGFDAVALNDFERGRALLLRGVVHRRLKEKAAAREALEVARGLFDSVGSAHFLARSDAELARLGRRSTDPLALTATERRVAQLVAGGLTNREVAERAFISVKTVEANLGRVYRKLGIRSRAELGIRIAAGTIDQ